MIYSSWINPLVKLPPSFFSNDCFVKSLIKLRFGTITNMDGIRSLARGRAIHDLYQEWFKIANPRFMWRLRVA